MEYLTVFKTQVVEGAVTGNVSNIVVKWKKE